MRATVTGAPKRRGLRGALAVVSLLAMMGSGLVALAPAASAEVIVRPSDGVLRVKGHGWGHGRGMSQWGAHGAASKGLSYQQILAFYYPGTTLTTQSNLSLTVRVTTDTDGITEVQAPIVGNAGTPSGTLRVASGSNSTAKDLPTDLGATRWRTSTSMDGTTSTLQYLSSTAGNVTWKNYDLLGNGTPLKAPVTFSSSTGHVRLLLGGTSPYYREYIGSVTGARYNGTHYSIVKTTMETYLRGVVPAEMPASWEAAAVRAQSVAARTYATNQRASSPSARPYQTCDSTSCQVFHGYADYTTSGTLKTARTNPLSDDAITGTVGVILSYGGKAAFTEFSASNGGYSVAGSVPYMVAKADPYDGVYPSSAHDWTDSITIAALEAKHPSIGTLSSISVDRDGHGDWGGRPDFVTLTGSTGSVRLSGSTFSSEAGFKHRWWALAEPQTLPPAPRLSGSDRYGTAAAIAAKFGTGVPVAYVASGADFPDALAAAAVAASRGEPVLLTKPGDLPDVTAAAISELAPGSIVILGGTGAVSTTVQNQLRALGVGTVSRIAGNDRYETAAEVAALLPTAKAAYVASGAAFPDALAGAALAGHLGAPVLLTKPTSLPDATTGVLAAQKPSAITVLGGTGVVSTSVATALGAYIVP